MRVKNRKHIFLNRKHIFEGGALQKEYENLREYINRCKTFNF